MPFSKFEPDRPPSAGAGPDGGGGLDASSEEAARRAALLRWVGPLVFAYTALGFVLMAYWLAKQWTGRPMGVVGAAAVVAFAGYAVGRLWRVRGLSRLHRTAWLLSLACMAAGLALLGALASGRL